VPTSPNRPDIFAGPAGLVVDALRVVAIRTGPAPAWPDGFVVDWQLESSEGGSR
jgi:hypothetical protein